MSVTMMRDSGPVRSWWRQGLLAVAVGMACAADPVPAPPGPPPARENGKPPEQVAVMAPRAANRQRPDVSLPASAEALLADPTAANLRLVRVTPLALAPVGTPSADDNARVATALQEAGTAPRQQRMVLGRFVEAQPASAWTPALLANLGHLAWQDGAFSEAERWWRVLWTQGRQHIAGTGRLLADEGLANLACYLAWSSQRDALASLVGEAGERTLVGAAGTRLANARSALEQMIQTPAKTFACGPGALHQLGVGRELEALVALCPATEQGTNLQQLASLATSQGMPMRPARRVEGRALVYPALVHWRVGHFSALTGEDARGRTVIRDTSFALFGQEELNVPPASVLDESSGAFLVRSDARLPPGWEWMDDAAAAAIWGRCGPSSFSPDDYDRGGTPLVGGGGNGCGMPTWSFFAFNATLSIWDTPMGYQPPRGERIDFTVDYISQESHQPAVFYYGNLGYRWTHSLFSYVIQPEKADDIISGGSNGQATIYPRASIPAEVYLPRGGYERYSSIPVWLQDGVNGIPTPASPLGVTSAHYRSGAQMAIVRTGGADDPSYFRRIMPDGSRWLYELPDGPNYPRRVFLTAMIDRDGNKTRLNYDAMLRLTSITDCADQMTTLGYDDVDPRRITSITDPFGRTARFAYDTQGRLISLTDTINLTSTIGYQGTSDQVASLTTPYGTTTFSMGGSGLTRWIETTDPQGDIERVQSGGLAPISFPEPVANLPLGMATANSVPQYYNIFFWDKKAMRMAPRAVESATHYRFCRNGSVITGLVESVKKPLQNRVWFQYPGQTATGTMSGVTLGKPSLIGTVLDDGSTSLIKMGYMADGKIAKVVDPAGRVTQYADNGRQVLPTFAYPEQFAGDSSLWDVLGSYTYDSASRVRTATDAAGQTTTMTYNGFGQVETVTLPPLPGQSALVYTNVYDAQGRLQESRDPAGVVTSFTYDSQSRVATATDRDGYTVTYAYDAFDRVVQVTHPDSTYEQIAYNRLDAEWFRDRAGRWTHVWYNAIRQPVAVRDPQGQVTGFDWCRCGALKKLWDPLGRMTTWDFDVQGRMTQKIVPDGNRIQYGYQPKSGRLATVTDAKGQVQQFTYTVDGALASLAYANTAEPTPGVSITYDATYRRPITMTDGTGTTLFAYHPVPKAGQAGILGAGQLASLDGPFANDVVSFAYDAWMRPVGRAWNGQSVTTAFDALGRVASVTNPLGAFTYAYVGTTGRIQQVSAPNGVVTAYSYTPVAAGLRLAGITTTGPGAAAISAQAYTYGVDGSILTWSQTAGGAAKVWRFEYDRANQLLAAIRTNGSVSGSLIQALGYSYDGAGNRESRQVTTPGGVATSRGTFNALNQLQNLAGAGKITITGSLDEPGTVLVNGEEVPVDAQNRFTAVVGSESAGSSTFSVQATDQRGNTSTKTYRVDTTAADAARTFAYDANGNCTSDGLATYAWDGADRLLRITRGTHRTEFAYDGLSRRTRIREYENNVLQQERHLVWVDGAIIGELNASDVRTIAYFDQGELSGTTKRYYTRDHLGSVREVLDQAGAVRARYDYDPYGVRTKLSGDWDVEAGYTGHYHHGPSGLVLTWFRAYDPTTGRWLSRDPAGEGVDTNLYRYIMNNPLNDTDPLGLWPPGYDNEEQWTDAMRSGGNGWWYRFSNRVGYSVSAIGNAMGSAVGLTNYDSELQRNANPLARADCQGGAVKYATYGAVGVAGAAVAGAAALGVAEVAAGAGYFNVAGSVAQRHILATIGNPQGRWFSQFLARDIIQNGARLTPGTLRDFFTTLSYQGPNGQVAFNFFKMMITHYRPF